MYLKVDYDSARGSHGKQPVVMDGSFEELSKILVALVIEACEAEAKLRASSEGLSEKKAVVQATEEFIYFLRFNTTGGGHEDGRNEARHFESGNRISLSVLISFVTTVLVNLLVHLTARFLR